MMNLVYLNYWWVLCSWIVINFASVLQIVDSIMALFRVDFSGRGELADRQQKLAQMLSRLQKISEGFVTFWLTLCIMYVIQLVYMLHVILGYNVC